MMENNDYSLASDQLYVLPFMRRYATFLALDPEETAMRFVREVQHAENNPGSRIDRPLDVDKSRRKSGGWSGWIGIAAAVVVIAIAGWLYMGRHSSDNTAPAAAVTSVPAAPAAASTTVSPAAPPLAAMNANAGGVAPGGASTTMRSGTQAPAANQHP
jgi:cytoskeletal protein RodZ